MTVTMTIVGLGRIGASIGLAMQRQRVDLLRIGNDINPAVLKRAREMGAVDEAHESLAASVKEADVVILALPVHHIRDTLSTIASGLKEHAVLLETSPCKEAVCTWVKELLPPHHGFAGIFPAINYQYLQAAGGGIETARADLFQKGLMAITAPQGMGGEAIQLAANLAGMLGAVPFFSSPEEVDGILSATHLMPQLTAAALASSVIESAGWIDRQKLAGIPFNAFSALAGYEESPTMAEAAFLGRENTIRCIDFLMEELETLRKMLQADDSSEMERHLVHVQKKLVQWKQDRRRGEWITNDAAGVDFPQKGEAVRHMFIGVRSPKKK